MYIVETTKGGWEGKDLESLSREMAEYYFDQETSVPNIRSVIKIVDDDEDKLPPAVIPYLVALIDDAFFKLRVVAIGSGNYKPGPQYEGVQL